MPRIRITTEHRKPVSIPEPVCPRCLVQCPGTPTGNPHPGPFKKDLCVACCFVVAYDLQLERGLFARSTSRVTEELASDFVAIRPMQSWPRTGKDLTSTPDKSDGPSRLALGPRDYKGQGMEAFWDQTPAERAAALPKMIADANLNCATKVSVAYLGVASENKAFALGWLDELGKCRSYEQSGQG